MLNVGGPVVLEGARSLIIIMIKEEGIIEIPVTCQVSRYQRSF